MAPTTPKPTRKTLLTTRVAATLANICHSVKVLLDFLFDGQEAAAKSGSAPAPGPQHQTTPQAPAPQQPNGTAADNELTVLGTDSRTSQDVPVSLSLDERLQSVYAIGANGTGKSTLLLNMVLSDIQQNRGLCLIEPHGDLTRQVIAAMAGERLKDVVYLDLKDSTASFSLNLFEVEPGADVTEIAKVASFVMHLFETVWNVGTETPRLQTVIRNITRVLIENPGIGTFSEIPLLLWEDVAREKLVRRVTNTQTKLFWSQYNKKTPRDREELIASTINKVDAYLN
jgi:hypothetical protein